MSTVPAVTDLVIGFKSAGMLLTPQEFDGITEYDESYKYELIHGVLVVNPIPSPEETGPNELLGHLLWDYQQRHSQGAILDLSMTQQIVRTKTGRRIADQLIWIGLGRLPDLRKDVASIAVEFVSDGRRNQRRDYVEKKQEYGEAGLQEYWIFDRFRRTLTVVSYSSGGIAESVIPEGKTFELPLLPGFIVPLARILASADMLAERQ
jgi:Uma2 family endonuclease